MEARRALMAFFTRPAVLLSFLFGVLLFGFVFIALPHFRSRFEAARVQQDQARFMTRVWATRDADRDKRTRTPPARPIRPVMPTALAAEIPVVRLAREDWDYQFSEPVTEPFDLAIDPKSGALWAATPMGLVRWSADGSQPRLMTLGQVTQVVAGVDGSIGFIESPTRCSGQLEVHRRDRDGHVTSLGHMDGLPQLPVSAFAIDAAGSVWTAHGDRTDCGSVGIGGLWRLAADGRMGMLAGTGDWIVEDIVASPAGSVWVAAGRRSEGFIARQGLGLSSSLLAEVFPSGDFQLHDEALGLDPSENGPYVGTLHVDRFGDARVTLRPNLVDPMAEGAPMRYQVTLARWTAVALPESLGRARVLSLTSDNALWLQSGGSVWRGSDGDWRLIQDPASPTEAHWGEAMLARRILAGVNGGIWLLSPAQDDGLHVNGAGQLVGKLSAMRSTSVSGPLPPHSDGWMSSYQAVNTYRDEIDRLDHDGVRWRWSGDLLRVEDRVSWSESIPHGIDLPPFSKSMSKLYGAKVCDVAFTSEGGALLAQPADTSFGGSGLVSQGGLTAVQADSAGTTSIPDLSGAEGVFEVETGPDAIGGELWLLQSDDSDLSVLGDARSCLPGSADMRYRDAEGRWYSVDRLSNFGTGHLRALWRLQDRLVVLSDRGLHLAFVSGFRSLTGSRQQRATLAGRISHRFQLAMLPSGVQPDDIRTVRMDPDGQIWIATRYGAHRATVTNDSGTWDWQSWTIADGLPDGGVWDLAFDHSRVWMGTEFGLVLVPMDTDW